MDYVIVKYLHFLGIFLIFATLILEHSLLQANSSAMNRRDMRKLALIDGIYGLAAVVTMIAGLLLWFKVGKGSAFYTPNHLLHLKVGLFAVMALLSIYPTVFFLKHRKTKAESTPIPKAIIMLVRCELLILLIIPALASMMAQGIGLGL